MIYSPEPNKLRRTLEVCEEKLRTRFSTATVYESMWDSEIDHYRDQIHGFTIKYMATLDDIRVLILDVDTEGTASQLIIDGSILTIYPDAWAGKGIYHISEYKKHDEGTYFQLSTVRDVPEFEVIQICAEFHEKFLQILGI